MAEYGVQGGRFITMTQELIRSAIRLFNVKNKVGETPIEQRIEERWADEYKRVDRINFSEIFSVRLTNYTLMDASITSEDENINECIQKFMAKAKKAVSSAYGIGRVYLVPYIIGNTVYTDIIPQNMVVTTDRRGDDTSGFVCVADIRTVGKDRVARLTHYYYDDIAHTYTIENKAVNFRSGGQIQLSAVEEWADIEPAITITGVDMRPFGIIDSPKDNRDADKMQGASIMFGTESTQREILECIEQYQVEYRHKVSVLGIDTSLIDKKHGYVNMPTEYVGYASGGMKNNADLFSVYAPEIRDTAYQARLLNLFARLEKQVGTSSGILTPADTSMATATQVKRSMTDTIAFVDGMQNNIQDAFKYLKYGYHLMLTLLHIATDPEAPLTFTWHDMAEDPTDTFSKLQQGHQAGVVSDIELRRFFYPNETVEEAMKAIEDIKASNPEPSFDELFPVEG